MYIREELPWYLNTTEQPISENQVYLVLNELSKLSLTGGSKIPDREASIKRTEDNDLKLSVVVVCTVPIQTLNINRGITESTAQ